MERGLQSPRTEALGAHATARQLRPNLKILLIASVVGIGCVAVSTSWAQSAPHHVLIADNAEFRTSPDASASSARHYTWSGKMTAEHAGDVVVMRFLRQQGTWLLVTNPSPDDELLHCYPRGLPGLGSAMRAELWVNQADVIPATNLPTKIEEGEQFLVVPTGVAVVKTATGSAVGLSGFVITTDNRLAVGNFFRPSPRGPQPPPAAKAIARDATLLFDGQPVVRRKDRWSTSGVFDVSPTGDDQFVTIRDGCLHLRAQTSGPAPIELADAELRKKSVQPLEDGPIVPAGTRLHFPDGRTAGEILEETHLPGDTRNVGAYACFTRLIGRRGDERPDRAHDAKGRLALCVPRAATEKKP